MTISPFDSPLFGPLFSDEEIASLFADEAVLASMIEVEVALAKAQAQAGVIPVRAYEQIAQELKGFVPNPEDLGQSTADDGVPIPALIETIRGELGDEVKPYLHWGATSQDVVDSALILRLKKVIAILEVRLKETVAKIGKLAREHAATIMVGRTRTQQAAPTTFGYKAVQWAQPMKRHLKRMVELRPRLLVLSLGGAVGTLAAIGEKAGEVEKYLAEELQLSLPETTWHSQRDGMVEFAGWLSMVTGSLGKMGQDLLLMAQSEVGEVRFSSSGSSSTMPQKSNPIDAEVIVTLSRLNAGHLNLFHQAQIQEHERGGPGWMLEWLVLPQMVITAASVLRHANRMIRSLVVEIDVLQQNLEQSNGLCLAEAAVFALSTHMSKFEAQRLVKDACQKSRRKNTHVIDILASQIDHPIDWKSLKNPRNYVGIAVEKAKKFKS